MAKLAARCAIAYAINPCPATCETSASAVTESQASGVRGTICSPAPYAMPSRPIAETLLDHAMIRAVLKSRRNTFTSSR